MYIKTIFGSNLKHYRKEKHLSQEELSESANISVKHLSKIERGLTFVSAELLEKLSIILEISVAQLFCKDSEKIYDDRVLNKFDRITEKHLIRAMEGIKGEIRQDNLDD
ncbi:MAG: helix-turn-helix domain-containing protein [Treponema sp.]|jgi:transcriptional regulator with XRE-family HTH domain|nr:helix-turn-helix domain-containing protein [Treponema sp.]